MHIILLITFKRKIFEVYYRLFDIVQFIFDPSMAYNANCNKEEIIEAIFVKGIMESCVVRLGVPKQVRDLVPIVSNINENR